MKLLFSWLISVQFMSLSRDSTTSYRLAIPALGSSSRLADFILSPLAEFECTRLLNRTGYTRSILNTPDRAEDITFVAGCTQKAVKYLKSKIAKIIVYGFGDGEIGYGKEATSFGMAGIRNGSTEYQECP
jgi:hypothetical protein